MKTRVVELELDNQLCFALYNASRAFTRAYRPLLAELGLTYPQYLVMLALWEADGAQSVTDLGQRLHLDSGTLTPLLKRLEQQGLLGRDRDADDERRVLVTLTASGRRLRARASSVPGEIFQRCGVSLDTGIALRKTLTRMADELDAASLN